MKTGVPNASPAAPVAGDGEVPLWRVHVAAGQVTLGGGDLTDERPLMRSLYQVIGDLAVANALIAALNAGAELLAHKGTANGYAGLDSGGKVPLAQLPAIAISDTFDVASRAAMLALTAERGDFARRTDINQTFILSAEPATTLGNWKQLLFPQPVTSFNTRTGAITLLLADVTAALGFTPVNKAGDSMTGPLSITGASGYLLSLIGTASANGLLLDLSSVNGILADLRAVGTSFFKVSLNAEPILQIARALNSNFLMSLINTGDTNARGLYIQCTNAVPVPILDLAGPGSDLFQFLTNGTCSLGLAAPS